MKSSGLMAASSTFKIAVLVFSLELALTCRMASFYERGCGTGPRGGRGRGHGVPSTYRSMDNNIFAVLSTHGDLEQNGDNVDDVLFNENSYLDMTVGYDSDKMTGMLSVVSRPNGRGSVAVTRVDTTWICCQVKWSMIQVNLTIDCQQRTNCPLFFLNFL